MVLGFTGSGDEEKLKIPVPWGPQFLDVWALVQGSTPPKCSRNINPALKIEMFLQRRNCCGLLISSRNIVDSSINVL